MNTPHLSLQPDDFSAYQRNLAKAMEDFVELKDTDTVLIITDDSKKNTDPALIHLLEQHLQERGISHVTLNVDKVPYEEVLKATREYSFIWSAHDWAPEDAPFNDFVDIIAETRARMAHCPGVGMKNLEEGGALTEDRKRLEERLHRMEHQLKDVRGFHIQTGYGTDLWMGLKHGERIWFKDSGKLRAGGWDNLPGGEIFTTPDEDNVNGTLVLPGLNSDVDDSQGVDEFVHLKIQKGKIVRIDGGKSAEKLRAFWEEWSKKHEQGAGGNPWDVVQCAEIAFGANEFARPWAAHPESPYHVAGTHTVEAEKRLGTMHIAFGNTDHGEPEANGRVKCEPHLDFVIPRNGLTVTAFKSRNDFERKKNGEKLADNGNWRHW